MEISQLISDRAGLIEKKLAGYVGATDADFGIIYDAMRYSLLGGGKRLRPFLVTEFAALAATENQRNAEEAIESSLAFAAAIEMIHTYSLIHDDLPCMDNDSMRRGKPTNHIRFGEANALLAGDGLLTLAFGTAASNDLVSPEIRCRAVRLLSECAGCRGMIGGQVMDLEGEKLSLNFDQLKKLQALKTGELIRCSSLLGCLAGGASEGLSGAAEIYSDRIGRVFQVIDDILDREGDEALLGKPVGSDEESGKTTFLTFMTVEEAREYSEELTDEAIEAVSAFEGSDNLIALAKYLLYRNK